MSPTDLRQIIKETVEKVLKESRLELDHLQDGISTSTIIGKDWFKLISNLESLINEMNEWKSQYSSNTHGPLPNVQGALVNLQMIVKLLTEVKPVVIGMDDIERKDMSENNPHGRYAQQAGATPFNAPGDQAINETKTFRQIRDEQDPDGTKHDVTIRCVHCENTYTCRCKKPKREFKGICEKCHPQ